ncbi:MAG: sugar-binding domain-containing protein [Verrucomicrobiae bacterium]
MKTASALRIPLASLFLALSGAVASGAVWIEGEAPSANPKPEIFKAQGAERSEFLSGGQWLMGMVDAGAVAQVVTEAGLEFGYAFSIAKEGCQKVWARVGFEFARSPFEWRIDGGDWKKVASGELTSDLYPLGFFCEAAWLNLGEANLTAGDHKIEFRLLPTKNEKGEVQRILFALDAICITDGEFVPNGKFQPGQEWREAVDLEAEQNVFQFPAKPAGSEAQTALKLGGIWQIARHDEQLPGETAAPIPDLPANPVWKGIRVPGDKGTLRPDMLFAHRVWYRTKVNIPDGWKGNSFYLVFPANNLNTTVLVNGQFVGFDKNPLARLQFDISKAVKPGVNEIAVGIKDAWYGYVADPNNPMVLRRVWNLPPKFFSNGFQKLVYPIWNTHQSGILGTPELVAAGPAYAADVFVKPSLARKELGLEVTLKNPGAAALSGELVCEAVNEKTGAVEFTAPSQPFSLDADKEQVLDFAPKWESPKLWWPDDPNTYLLRTTVKVAGKPVDVKETMFGFREWTIDGVDMKLNGVRWQGMSECGISDTKTPEDWLAKLHDPKTHYGFGRMWMTDHAGYFWLGKDAGETLNAMDRGGAVIRRSGHLDGQLCGYEPSIFPELGKNWLDHLAVWMKGERNHPSIFIWSIENELNFINARNLGRLDVWEPILAKGWEVAQKVDPTRPVMVDGGGATRAQALPIHGDHYSTKSFGNYPQLAYEANADQKPWTWDQKRPKFIGEELFAAGINPAYAYFGGEQVFKGKSGNRPAVGIALQVISEGYRWFGITGCDFWQAPSDSDDSQYNSWSPRAVLVRQWDYTFGSGEKAKRTLGILNNTRFPDPLTLTWKLTVGGKDIASKSSVHNVAPGMDEKFDIELAMPEVKAREEGELVLTLSAAGKEIFRSVKAISVLPPATLATKIKPGALFVYDPKGKVTPALQAQKIPFTPLNSLAAPTAPGKIWLVGPDALTAADSTSSAFCAYALAGGRVIILEQDTPLKYQGLVPASIPAQVNLGRVAFTEDAGHPLLRGLQDKDFFTWEPGEVVYKNAYLKPERGARSLVQCNEALLNSALLTIPVGEGLVTLSQLVVAEKLATNAVAQTLLANALSYSAAYKLELQKTAAAADSQLLKVLDAINLQYSAAPDPLAAMKSGKIAVISATPANLKSLADNPDKVKAFNDGGGWLVLNGLTPDGLADYNKLVGFEHMIRPFQRERVNLATPRNRWLAGVALSDIALSSSERLFSFQEGTFVASDIFSYIVDLDDVAPFGKWDKDIYNRFGAGFVQADGWKYTLNHPVADAPYLLTFPKPQEIISWVWDGNNNYDATTQVDVTPDATEAAKRTFDVREDGEATTLPVEPPLTATSLSFRHAKHTTTPAKQQNGVTLVGLDNIQLFAKRPADFHERVKPMLNIGGIVEYPRGKGGIILCNLLFKDAEDVPVNVTKKRSVLASLLRNLGSPFGGGKTVIAGSNLDYSPVAIDKQANQFRTERGWFGDAAFTLGDLPTGEQTLAGVKYDIFEFKTSPVPTCIMLAGNALPNNPPGEVKGIPVGKKAHALFFLHTGRVEKRPKPEELKKGKKFEMFRYVVHYADGKEEIIPIFSDSDIGDYKTKSPVPLPGAQLAWTKPYAGTEFSAAVYSKQWDNPRPDVAIESIDMVYGPEKSGVPVLLGITAGRASK